MSKQAIIAAIKTYATEAIRRGFDFPSDFYGQEESYEIVELIEFHGEIRDFIGFERGYSVGAEATRDEIRDQIDFEDYGIN